MFIKRRFDTAIRLRLPQSNRVEKFLGYNFPQNSNYSDRLISNPVGYSL